MLRTGDITYLTKATSAKLGLGLLTNYSVVGPRLRAMVTDLGLGLGVLTK